MSELWRREWCFLSPLLSKLFGSWSCLPDDCPTHFRFALTSMVSVATRSLMLMETKLLLPATARTPADPARVSSMAPGAKNEIAGRF